jgi:hypothetical protein
MNKNEQQLTLEIGEVEIDFKVTRDIFNKYTNEIQTTDKVAPSHNFLMRCVENTSKDDLKTYIKENPGSELDLAGTLSSEFKPDTNIVVKKRSDKPSK